jgi:peptide/nickel transport system substrate-binding protein
LDLRAKLTATLQPSHDFAGQVSGRAGQLFTGQLRRHTRAAALVTTVCVLSIGAACRRAPDAPSSSGRKAVRGGEIVASVHSEPSTFNRYVRRDSTADLVSTLTHAKLLRLNRVTQEVEPWLAESWTRSDDGLRYALKLRRGITFSDGHAFTADDVVFSFEAVYDEKSGSVLGDALKVGGEPLQVAAPDPSTVVVTFPERFTPGLRLLDNLPILPRHKLGAALKAGTFDKAWSVTTPVADLVGLGPFVINQYVPGQRLVFARNPRYWRTDADGAALPYLDRVTVEIIPDQDTELLRLLAGQLDMTAAEMRPEDYTSIKRAADAGRVQLLDLGAGFDLDNLWFNLTPGALGPANGRAGWLQADAFRRAISLAVDRERFANTVFLGAGVPVYGPITPANKKWYAALPPVPYDPAGARRELASIGLMDRNGDGQLEDAHNQPVRFSLLAQTGNSSIERGAAVIRDELKKIGVAVDVVGLEAQAVIQRFVAGRFDAVLYRIAATDTDPAINPDFWFSSGSAHVWNPEQKSPATAWEAQIDDLMRRQSTSPDEAERKRLFDQVQQVYAEHLPTIPFVAPHIYVAVSTRVTNLTPTAFSRPQLLWSPDTIAVVH